ncbi:hypothetical protein CIB95_09240 [Lottiidibacillus patelloidae]|uniref:Uncharacterized protein n=2 Tax=Lottiidibacillus patelloidae TaxID=2670334 RepID=A0A263BTA5_9BACI|nr:hypothetical protein CIB95_09240 [Lottiidibacillus patelloidae]
MKKVLFLGLVLIGFLIIGIVLLNYETIEPIQTMGLDDKEDAAFLESEAFIAELEAKLGEKFLIDSFTAEMDGPFIEVDEETMLTVYEINGDTIQNKIDIETNDDLLAIQEDVELQQELWTLFQMIIPLENRGNIVKFGFFTDGPDNTLAYVEQVEDDPTKWIVVIDLQDGTNLATVFATLIHEYAHVLSLNDKEVEINEDVFFDGDEDLINDIREACQNLYLDEGCTNEDSYINQYYEMFWLDLQLDWEAEVIIDDEESVRQFYERHEEKFVNEYAATNIVEDFAETFTYFVLKPKPKGENYIEEKLLFFYQFPELVELRAKLLLGLEEYLDYKEK